MMPDEVFSQEQIESAPSLRGKFDSKHQKLVPLERAVARHQGLLEEDGETLKDEAVRPPGLQLPANMPETIPLEDLAPDKATRIEEQIQENRGENSDPATVEDDNLVGAGLAPPPFAEGELADDPGEPPGDSQTAAASVDIGRLIRESTEPLRCGHCGWDQRESFKPPSFSEEDKMAFVRHVMSKNGRFFHTFNLFNADVTVTLRSRSQLELESILECARQELKDEELAGIGDMQAQLQRYHIAASVAKIVVKDDPDANQTFAPLSDSLDSGAKVAVKAKDKEVFGSGQSTGLYNIVTALWMEFERLYGYFASRAHEPDFWKAAAGDHS